MLKPDDFIVLLYIPITYSVAPPLMSYIPYIVSVVEAFIPEIVLYVLVFTELAVDEGLSPIPVIYDVLLFIPTSVQVVLFVHLPYILCVKYATAPHSLFLLIWVSTSVLTNPKLFPLCSILLAAKKKLLTFWFLNDDTFGFTTILLTLHVSLVHALASVPPISNLPYQNPLNSLSPKVKASIAVSFSFTNVTSIAPGASLVPPL